MQHLGVRSISGETEYLVGMMLIRAKKLKYHCLCSKTVDYKVELLKYD